MLYDGSRAMRPTTIAAILLGAAIASALVPQDGAKPGEAQPAPQKTLVLKTPQPVPDGRIAKLENLGSYACAQCHLEVANEWATTTHALSWLDPLYREALAEKSRPEACHGCHIPKPLHLGKLGEQPQARAESKEDPWEHGISCESCHLGPDGAILGPWGHATPAHVSKRSASMVEEGSTELCLSCHKVNVGPVIGIAKDFVSSNQSGRGRSCVGCHWAPVERSWANPAGPTAEASAPAAGEVPVRKGRSHATQTPRDPAFLRQAFEVSARVEGGKTLITLRNATGHRVPGLIGRSFDFSASVLDAGGKTLAEKQQSFDTRAHLPVDKSIEIAVAAVGAQVRLVGMHNDPRLEKPVLFMDLKLDAADK